MRSLTNRTPSLTTSPKIRCSSSVPLSALSFSRCFSVRKSWRLERQRVSLPRASMRCVRSPRTSRAMWPNFVLTLSPMPRFDGLCSVVPFMSSTYRRYSKDVSSTSVASLLPTAACCCMAACRFGQATRISPQRLGLGGCWRQMLSPTTTTYPTSPQKSSRLLAFLSWPEKIFRRYPVRSGLGFSSLGTTAPPHRPSRFRPFLWTVIRGTMESTVVRAMVAAAAACPATPPAAERKFPLRFTATAVNARSDRFRRGKTSRCSRYTLMATLLRRSPVAGIVA
mmetsp:Transcript_73347/g.122522  ORF Transcript_73347/g.122522 Transcript_73347/m.122522 type:complete len:281 (+) Transcript_73347:1206-2048(+)